MKRFIAWTIIVILWISVLTCVASAQTTVELFGESIPIVFRDGHEKEHIIRDEIFALTFLAGQKVMTGKVNPASSIVTAGIASAFFEGGQATAGHQFSVLEFLITPAVMALNIIVFDWGSDGNSKQRPRDPLPGPVDLRSYYGLSNQTKPMMATLLRKSYGNHIRANSHQNTNPGSNRHRSYFISDLLGKTDAQGNVRKQGRL